MTYRLDDSPKQCVQCGKDLNPIQILLGPVCGDCTRKNHKEVTQ